MPSTDDDADTGLLSPLWAGTPVAAVTSDLAVLHAIVRFEAALATVTAPPGVAARITAAGVGLDPAEIAREARAGGNPVIPTVNALRAKLDDEAAHWLHRGATSQDALDTALALVAKDAVAIIIADATAAVEAFAVHAVAHRETVMVGRTLTQPATPITLGLKLAGWARGVASAAAEVRRAAAAYPVQLGGAAGTLAAFTASGADSIDIASRLARDLGLADPVAPWHVWRAPVTRLGDTLVEMTDAFGTVSENTTALARLGELDDGAAGGSSTMPQKSNPVRAVLINAASRQATHLLSALHTAAITVDERPDGAWHAEWEPFRSLLRIAGGAASLGRDLAEGLRVHPEVIAAHVTSAGLDLIAERQRFAIGDAVAADYLGVAGELVDRLLAEAREVLE
ncbi:lyase family protein [Pseudolysinimonas sp.]|uniref:lyase family protein n=1 Tax=Pseudolysinimonas sp. TaxID=2680009 RepID=UPI0037830BF5